MPNELAFNTAQAYEDIYGHRQGRPNMTRDPIHVGAVESIPGVSNLTMASEADHPRQRRALAYAFSKKALMEQEDSLLGYVKLFVNRLQGDAREKEPVNLVSWFNYCTFDIIGDLSFGEPFGCLKEGLSRLRFLETTKALLRSDEQARAVILHSGWFLSMKASNPVPLNRPLGDLPKLAVFSKDSCSGRVRRLSVKGESRHLENSREKTIRRMNQKTEHKDFLWYILKQSEKKNEVSDNEVIMNAALFM